MVRPRKHKLINFQPNVTYFKPKGVPLRELSEVKLTFDELETLRLSNIDNLNQTDAAKKMHIHQSTFQRTLTRARKKITNALINGKAIKICGGDYKTSAPLEKLNIQCKCPNCRHIQTHTQGTPCNTTKCIKCNTLMNRIK